MKEFEDKIFAAREDLEKGNFKNAAVLYLSALKIAPDDKYKAIICAELSWAYYGSGKFKEALESAESTLKQDAHYKAKDDIYRVMGFCHLALNNETEAEKYLEESVNLDRSSEKQQITLYELVKLYFKKQKYNEALNIIKDIETYFYQNKKDYWLSILFYKGFIYYYKNDLDNSEPVFEELLENAREETRKAGALFGLAFVNFTRKEYLKTINLCEAVMKSDPQFFDTETIGFLTAGSFFYLGRKDIFEKYYDQLHKKYPEGRYNRELKQMKAEIKT